MKNKMIVALLSVFALTLSIVPINAKEDTVVTFEGDAGKFIVQDGDSQGFKDMQPGESRTVVVTLSNDHSDAMDFFMSAEILDNIAEKGNKDAVYDFKIARNDEVFFATVIGATGNTIGQEYLTDDNNIKLATLAKNESCKVAVTLSLDGDSTENSYMNQEGQIKLNFLVGTPTNPVGQKQTVIQKVIQYIKTGDNTPILLLSGLLVGSIIGFVIIKRKKKAGN